MAGLYHVYVYVGGIPCQGWSSLPTCPLKVGQEKGPLYHGVYYVNKPSCILTCPLRVG